MSAEHGTPRVEVSDGTDYYETHEEAVETGQHQVDAAALDLAEQVTDQSVDVPGDAALRLDEYATTKWGADAEFNGNRLAAFREANVALAGLAVAAREGLELPPTSEKLVETTERAGRILELDAMRSQPYEEREAAFRASSANIAGAAMAGTKVDLGYIKANDILGATLSGDPGRHAR